MSGSDRPQYIADDYNAIAQAMKNINAPEPVPTLLTRPGFATEVRRVSRDGCTIYCWQSNVEQYRGWYALGGRGEEKGGPYNTEAEARDAALGEGRG